MADRLPNFEKLSGEENWPKWKAMMITYFKALKLYKLLDGTRTLPVVGQPAANPATEADLDDYETDCARVGNILNNMIQSTLFNVYSGPNLVNVREQWQALLTYFDRPTVANKMDILTQLINVQQREDQSVDEYFCVITELVSKLEKIRYS